MAVLDGNFSVRGVAGLRVVDASSWPDVPGYFITTPTYMVSSLLHLMQGDAQRSSARFQKRPRMLLLLQLVDDHDICVRDSCIIHTSTHRLGMIRDTTFTLELLKLPGGMVRACRVSQNPLTCSSHQSHNLADSAWSHPLPRGIDLRAQQVMYSPFIPNVSGAVAANNGVIIPILNG